MYYFYIISFYITLCLFYFILHVMFNYVILKSSYEKYWIFIKVNIMLYYNNIIIYDIIII